MRACPCLVLLLAVVACQPDRSSSSPKVLAEATVGPSGGVLAVDSGKQAGLRIYVPAGAVAADVRLRVVDTDTLPLGLLATVYTPAPGKAFRVEPLDTAFAVPLTLRMPYDPSVLTNTAPGNVHVRLSRPGTAVAYPPEAIDAVAGFVMVSVSTLGEFRVERALQTFGLVNYRGPLPANVALSDGWAFAAERLPDETMPFGGPQSVRWHLTGPGFDETFYLSGAHVLARATPDWLENWSEPVQVWNDGAHVTELATAIPTQIGPPLAAATVPGTLVVSGSWRWDLPRHVGSHLSVDVVRLAMTLAWNRPDLGTGQREYVFWFAPDLGLLALGIDGVVHERTVP